MPRGRAVSFLCTYHADKRGEGLKAFAFRPLHVAIRVDVTVGFMMLMQKFELLSELLYSRKKLERCL